MTPDCDVVVVGAGLAGLTAARTLVRAGRSVLVVEARDRVGGRTLNLAVGDAVVEMGGQGVGPSQSAVRDLAREVGVGTFPTHNTGEALLEWRGGTVPHGSLAQRHRAVSLDLRQGTRRLDRRSRTVTTSTPWSGGAARRHDGTSVADWVRRTFLTAGARELFSVGVRSIWAVEPEDLSLLHALFTVRTCGGWAAIVDIEGGAQQDRLAGGSQQISLRLAEELGDRVLLSRAVTAVEQDDDGVTVRTADGDLRAGHAVVTLPPALAGRLGYAPPLPAAQDRLLHSVPMGSVLKCHAVYPEPFWREQGRSGAATSACGPLQLVFDNSPEAGRPGVLVGFALAGSARRLAGLSPEERREAVLAQLGRLFGPEAAAPEQLVEHDWSADPFSGGGYMGVWPPGVWTQVGDALRVPHGRVHFAGAEHAQVWNGYMEGAVRSGRGAAEAVLAG